jgi:hypothetical protein
MVMKSNFSILAIFLLFAFQTFGIQVVELPKSGNLPPAISRSGSPLQNKNNKFLIVVAEESEENCEDDSDTNNDSNQHYFFAPSQIFHKFHLEKSTFFLNIIFIGKTNFIPIYLKYRNLRL